MRVFLTAEWRDLAILNYAVDAALLRPWVPEGTQLDYFAGRTYISLVGFRFQNTRVMGMGVPFHRNFDEVNLRFYVKRVIAGEVRRGVVFLREIVPRRAIASVARRAYGEPYVALPMSHRVGTDSAEYRWESNGRWNSIRAEAAGELTYAAQGTLGEFITEHYWGYSNRYEYRVEHSRWRLRTAHTARFEGDATFYGAEFKKILTSEPDSAILAEGSPVSVFHPRKMIPRE